jgi:hypothetical protein
VEDATAMVGEYDEDEEHAQMRGGYCEEIDGDEVLDMVGQERAPGLGGRGASLGDQPGDGALGHGDAKLEEFAMDSGGAPQGIRFSHS